MKIKIKVKGSEFDDREFTVPTTEDESFTLGELSLIKKYFGVAGDDMTTEAEDGSEIIDLHNPDVLQGLLFTLIHREHPGLPYVRVRDEVGKVRGVEIEVDTDDAEADAEDPTQLAVAADLVSAGD